MPGHDIIVIGGSAGGVEALQQVVAGLPPDLPASIFVVIHIPPNADSRLPSILKGPLQAVHAVDGMEPQPGMIYVAPPDRHMMLEPGRIRLTRAPRENRVRPAADPLFRSAAYAYDSRVIGVILSGALDDGTAGLWAIKDRGGLAVVQDPLDALYPGMPGYAIRHVNVDHVLPVSQIADCLARLAREPSIRRDGPPSDKLKLETLFALEHPTPINEKMMDQLGTSSPFTCPECHGVLWYINEGHMVHLRCRTGHAFSAESFMAELSENIEATLWNTVRAMEEYGSFMRFLVKHMDLQNGGEHIQDLDTLAQQMGKQIALIRQAVETGLRHHVPTPAKPAQPADP